MPDGLDRDRVPMAGGALLIAAVATCDLVRTPIVVSLVVVARCLIPTLRFLLRSLLVASAILLIGACGSIVGVGTLGSGVVIFGSQLDHCHNGGTLGSAACTLGSAAGTLGSVACCGTSIGSSNRRGCLISVALVASTILCRSFASGDDLSCPVNPLMALAHSASASITLSACVMVGLVMRLCWNCTVSDNRSLLVCLMWHVCVR